MTTIKAGIDAGNNGTKFNIEGQEPFMIPAVYSEYLGDLINKMDLEEVEADKLTNNLDVTIISESILLSNTRFIVGQKVLDDKLEAIEMEKKSNKATDDVPLITALAGLATDAIRRNPGQDDIKQSYDVGAALPIGSINKESAAKYEQRFIGTHIVKFHHPNGTVITVTITIEFCKCLPEGAAAAWGVVYDEKGKPIKRKIEIEVAKDQEPKIETITYDDKSLLHFDIGAGTTEIVVTKGVSFNPNLSEPRGYGTKQTILEIVKRWNLVYPRKTIDSIVEFNEIYFDSEHPRHSTLKEFAVQFIRQLATKFSSDVINKIDEMKDDPFVFIYGGGAILIKSDLEKILKHKDRLKNVVFINDPMYVNSRGLLVYVSSPRFQQLKEQKVGVSN
ncbi:MULTISPECIES: ParM/StbA family protein [Bacilli]|uniref:ParM/StbA family protein n=1 Tax=Bacilli TaxID=91061 RepID=UPI00203B6749|nr:MULTISPECIES: ParM/StbA family protein [Bacilli]MCM3032895.1 ParM/StbA family protein [Niallia sp. MER 6]MDK8746889.1 ParM/StbA family protein [Streptococcus agalactiae]